MHDEHVDVLIVGAGLSGIGAACHLQDECPDKTFTVLEARDVIGGTWDLFRYPGIRSDSYIDVIPPGYSSPSCAPSSTAVCHPTAPVEPVPSPNKKPSAEPSANVKVGL